jgi:hypothetical protein
MFGRSQGYFPISLGKAFPPIQLDNPSKTKVVRQVADAPRHDTNLRVGQPAQGRFVKVIEMSVSQQHQVDRRQVLEAQTGTLNAFKQEQPVGEVGIDQYIQIGKLNQERSVTNPGQSHLAVIELGKHGAAVLADTTGQQCLPHHFPKKSARIEMFCRSEILKRAGQGLANDGWAKRLLSRHKTKKSF